MSTERTRDKVQTFSMAIGIDQTRVRSILIVEDDEDIADSIRYNLEREGFRVRVATTGEDALDLISTGPPNFSAPDVMSRACNRCM